jgi:opacity protein-like surface antigen
MTFLKAPALLVLAVFSLSTPAANPQATPTAIQGLQLSAFGAASGVFTGFEGGHNLSFTAGVDLSFRPFRGFYPSLEARGTYPIEKGQIASQKDALGGIRIERPYNHLHPYVDFLVGRGEIDYQRGGFAVGTITYISTSSTVYSPGGGVDFDISHHLSLKTDYQYQLWDTLASSTGSIQSSILTGGVVYRFDFNRSYSRQRHPASTGKPSR